MRDRKELELSKATQWSRRAILTGLGHAVLGASFFLGDDRAKAQANPKQQPTDAWITFRSSKGGFSVALPSLPQTAVVEGIMTRYVWEAQDFLKLQVIYADVPKGNQTPEEAMRMLADTTLDAVRKNGFRDSVEKNLTLMGCSGIAYQASDLQRNIEVHLRWYARKQRIYHLSAYVSDAKRLQAGVIARYMDSLRFIETGVGPDTPGVMVMKTVAGRCSVCSGAGIMPCPRCNGRRVVPCSYCHGSMRDTVNASLRCRDCLDGTEACSNCRASAGRVPCYCGGSGVATQQVWVPALASQPASPDRARRKPVHAAAKNKPSRKR